MDDYCHEFKVAAQHKLQLMHEPNILIFCHKLFDEDNADLRGHSGECCHHLEAVMRHKEVRSIFTKTKDQWRAIEEAVNDRIDDLADLDGKKHISLLTVCKKGRHRSVSMARLLWRPPLHYEMHSWGGLGYT